jgi:hypothetical protein
MRRWTAATVVVLMMSGCSARAEPPRAAPAPARTEPTAAPLLCHAEDLARTAARPTGSVDCAADHRTETVATGTFTADLAGSAHPPAAASASAKAAFADCDKEAAGFLGADWRTARLRMALVLPTAEAWSEGGRWYRCDVVQLTGVGPGGSPQDRAGSLRGALRRGSDLLLVCNRVEIDRERNVAKVPVAPCDQAHEGEFVGVWRAPDKAYPAMDADYAPFYDGCRRALGAYVGVPIDGDLVRRAGVLPLPADEAGWQAGDRGVRCYLWLSDRKLTASLKGAGEKGLPLRLGNG